MRRLGSLLAVFGIICLVTLPLFFESYRIAAFHTMPRDDYAPFLLWFTTAKGMWPGSPYGYRVLSIIPAIPLYWLLPVYRFSQLGEIDPSYLRATEALTFLSFLATAGSATIAYYLVLHRLQRSHTQAALAAFLTALLARYSGGLGGVDPTAIFVIFALLCVIDRPALFGGCFLAAPFVNEKVAFFFVFLMGARSLFMRGFLKTHFVQAASVAGAMIVYIGALAIVHLSGNEGQLDIHRRIPEIIAVWSTSSSSLKGLVSNLLPVLLFAVPCVWWSLFGETTPLLTGWDCLVPLGLFVVGLSLTQGYEVGRIVAYALPLTVLSSVLLIAENETRRSASMCDVSPGATPRENAGTQ